MQKDILFEILGKGVLAPSADNLQPWKFRIANGHVDFYLDRQRLGKFSDAGLCKPYVSAGAVLENIRIAAAHFKFRALFDYFPDSSDAFRVAAIHFQEDPEICSEYEDWLEVRRTNRAFYHPHVLVPESLLKSLSQLATESGCKLFWTLRQSADYGKLVPLLGQADQMRFEVPRLHREFMEILRLNSEKAQERKDGLDVRCLESGPTGAVLFKLISSWPRAKFFNALGVSRTIGRYTRRQLESSSGLGLLVAADSKPESWIRGGQLMQRLWLEMTRQGYSIQPMEALPIFLIHLRFENGCDFNPDQRKKLEKWKKDFFSFYGIDENHALILLFRFGIGDIPKIRSQRRPLASFLIP